MKFSEIEEEQWSELQPYLDTCLVPITGLTGEESPVQTTKCLEELRDIMDLVEVPFKGRVVTYPACHYWSGQEEELVTRMCSHLKQQGFKYIILITAKLQFTFQNIGADLMITKDNEGNLPSQEEVSRLIRELWKR